MKTRNSPTKTSTLRSSVYREPVARPLVALLFCFACFALSPQARAVCREGCDLTFNTFLGGDALTSNTTGTENTAIGSGALTFNTTGFDNTAIGSTALYSNTAGRNNTAVGEGALFLNTTGATNTAIGDEAMVNNKTGGGNTAVGFEALLSSIGNNNTAVGFGAGSSGNNNIALGFQAGIASLDNDIYIGNPGGVESGTIRIGREGTHTATYIAGIRQTPLIDGGAVAVGITPGGQLGVRPSSARFKEAIKPMDTASEAVLALKPVTFRYKSDPAALPQFGLVAEEVANVNPDLVARDKEGKPFTVRYDEINTMLLNEFLKEHRRVEEQASKSREQDATIAQLKSAIAKQHKDFQTTAAQQQEEIEALQATLKEQVEQIKKVSAQLSSTPFVTRVVANE